MEDLSAVDQIATAAARIKKRAFEIHQQQAPNAKEQLERRLNEFRPKALQILLTIEALMEVQPSFNNSIILSESLTFDEIDLFRELTGIRLIFGQNNYDGGTSYMFNLLK